MRACCPLTFSLVARYERADTPLDPAVHLGCVGMPALVAGTVSYPHMHLVQLHGQPGWVAALTYIPALTGELAVGIRDDRRAGQEDPADDGCLRVTGHSKA